MNYIIIFNKRNIPLALLCAFITFLPLFVVSLFYDIVEQDTLISFFPFILAAVGVAVTSLNTIRFKRMIRAQEKRYGIQFRDTNSKLIEKTIYLSDEWLIQAGICAFYKNHIKSIKSIELHGRGGLSYRVIIKTKDNKRYAFWCRSLSCVRKIKKWKNT